ncbi:MAG TPA: WG repeat-containing protein [Bacteroidia bacterium]|nr:WG repeat-containing protein [Bacteroidia bacterium]
MLLFFVSDSLHARLPDRIPYRKGNLWGFCDSAKKILIEPRWKDVGYFSGNAAKVSDGSDWALIDTAGNLITRMKYEWISDEAVNGTRTASLWKYGKQGAINDRGEVVVPFDYDWLIWSGTYLQGMKNDLTGFWNSEGKVVIPFIYNGRGDVPRSMGDSGLFVVREPTKKHHKPGLFGVIDTAGNVIIPFVHDWINANECGSFQDWSWEKERYTYYDTRGNVIDTTGPCPKPDQYYDKGHFSYGFAPYRFDTLEGYVNEKHEIVIQPVYCSAGSFGPDGLARVSYFDPVCGRCKYWEGVIDIRGTQYWEN